MLVSYRRDARSAGGLDFPDLGVAQDVHVGVIGDVGKTVQRREFRIRRAQVAPEARAALPTLGVGDTRPRSRHREVQIRLRCLHDPIGRAQPVGRLRIGSAAGRHEGEIGRPGDVHDRLGHRIVRLEVVVCDRPVLAASIAALQAEIVRMHPWRGAAPAVGAAAIRDGEVPFFLGADSLEGVARRDGRVVTFCDLDIPAPERAALKHHDLRVRLTLQQPMCEEQRSEASPDHGNGVLLLRQFRDDHGPTRSVACNSTSYPARA